MQNYRKAAKSDGYIKNQNISMRKTRTEIFLKIALVVVPLVLFLIFFAGLILSTPSPEKWQHNIIVDTPDGKGRVIEVNLITGMLKVSLDRRPDAAPVIVNRHQVKLLKDAHIRIEKEELEALKGIE